MAKYSPLVKTASKVSKQWLDGISLLTASLVDIHTHPDIITLILRAVKNSLPQVLIVGVEGHESEPMLHNILSEQNQISWLPILAAM